MRYKILLILFLIALVSSAILSFNNISEVCEPGEGCTIVGQSEYNHTFGIKNSYYGTAIFLLMSILTFSEIRKSKKMKRFFINLGVVIGAFIALYFIYLQQFIIKAYCKYCMAVDISMLVALLVIFVSWRRNRKWAM